MLAALRPSSVVHRNRTFDQPLVIRKYPGGNPRKKPFDFHECPTFSEHKGNMLQLMSCMEKSIAMGSMYGIFTYIYHNF